MCKEFQRAICEQVHSSAKLWDEFQWLLLAERPWALLTPLSPSSLLLLLFISFWLCRVYFQVQHKQISRCLLKKSWGLSRVTIVHKQVSFWLLPSSFLPPTSSLSLSLSLSWLSAFLPHTLSLCVCLSASVTHTHLPAGALSPLAHSNPQTSPPAVHYLRTLTGEKTSLLKKFVKMIINSVFSPCECTTEKKSIYLQGHWHIQGWHEI